MGPIGEELKNYQAQRDAFQLIDLPPVTPEAVIFAFIAGILLGMVSGAFQ